MSANSARIERLARSLEEYGAVMSTGRIPGIIRGLAQREREQARRRRQQWTGPRSQQDADTRGGRPGWKERARQEAAQERLRAPQSDETASDVPDTEEEQQ